MIEKRHNEYRERIRAFAVEKIEPLAITLDQEQRFPTEHMGPLTEMGLMSMLIPPEYGGEGADTVSYVLALSEIAYSCASTAVVMSVQNSIVCESIYKYGSEKFTNIITHRKVINIHYIAIHIHFH